MQSWNPSAMGERTGRRLPPGSIYSGPFVLPLRWDSRIASELRGDSGLRRYFDCDCAIIFLVPIILPPIVLTGLQEIVLGL